MHVNIVILHAHALGRYLANYGRPVETPQLMKFGQTATAFRKAFAAAPVRSPSQAALFCGQMPHLLGMLGPVERGFALTHEKSHIAHVLGAAGYESVHAGVQHLFADDAALPFERVLAPQGADGLERDLSTAQQVCAFLRERAATPSPDKKLFFLVCGFSLAMRPFIKAAEDAEGLFSAPACGLPDTPQTRGDFSDYRHNISFLDNCVGEVLQTLEQTGRFEDTLIVFTTDCGGPFPMAMGQLTDEGIGVSLLVHYPGNPSAGKVSDALVSQLDIFPTLCDFAGIEPPQWLAGHSLRPIFERKRSSVREELMAQSTYFAAYEPMRCIRTTRYKLVKRYDPDSRPVAVNIPDSPSKDALYEAGWGLRDRPQIALYDLTLDPLEQSNLYDIDSMWSVQVDLLARMEGFLRETLDPLMKGFVPPPKGTRVNHRSQRSASEPTCAYE